MPDYVKTDYITSSQTKTLIQNRGLDIKDRKSGTDTGTLGADINDGYTGSLVESPKYGTSKPKRIILRGRLGRG